MKIVALVVLLTLTLVSLPTTLVQAADWVRPTITASRTSGRGAFEMGMIMHPFVVGSGGLVSRQATRLQVSHDGTNLYVTVYAEEKDMPTVRLGFSRGRPERVRDDDSVSLYFRIGEDVLEFTGACDGKFDDVRWSGGKQEPGWVSGASWAVDRADEWMGTFTIPLSALGSPAPGEMLELNAVRREAPQNEISSWPGYAGTKDPPTEWGALRIGLENAPFQSQYIITPINPGLNRMHFWVKPATAKGQAEVLFANDDKPSPLPLVNTLANPDHNAWYTYEFQVPPGAPAKAQVIMRLGDEVLQASAVIDVPMPLITAQIAEAQTRLKYVMYGNSVLQMEYATSLRKASEKLASDLTDANRKAKTLLAQPFSNERVAGLTELSERVGEMSDRSQLFLGRLASLKKGGAVDGFSVGTMHSVVKLRRFDANLEYGTSLNLRVARRERESGQVVIVPFDQDLTNVKVSFTRLVGPKGAVIPKSDVRVDIVGYVKTTPPDYETEYVGWWADPLMPLEPFDVKRSETQPLWVTAYARENTPAGVYKGSLTIDAGVGGRKNVPISLEVLDYDLPLYGRLRTIFGLHWSGSLLAWYGWDEAGGDGPGTRVYKNIPQSWARQIWDMTLSYRIYAGGLYEFLPFPKEEDVDFCLERGMNNYQIGVCESEKDFDHFKQLADKVRARGLMPISYVYGWDEYPEYNERVRQEMLRVWGKLKQEIPDLPRADVYTKPGDEMMQAMDIVMPATQGLEDQAKWDKWRANGKLTGAYLCCGPRHPYANFFIDYPAIDQRVVFWQMYDYKVKMLLYYAINNWRQSLKQQPRWPDGPWVTASHGNDNGDGHLIYPGKKEVLASVRLANVRDGIEDYEALVVLEELTAKLDKTRDARLIAQNRKLLDIPPGVSKDLRTYTKDPRVLLAVRRELDNRILATKRALVGH